MRRWVLAAALLGAIGAGVGAVTVGQVKREALPQLDGAPAWAGGRPDVAACERYIRNGLSRPSSYRRLEVLREDEQSLSQAAFDRAAGIEKAAPARPARRSPWADAMAERDQLEQTLAELERDRAVGHVLGLRRVGIRYEADDPTSTGIGACAFRLIDGELDSVAELRARADRAGGDRNLRDAAILLGAPLPRRRSGALACCL